MRFHYIPVRPASAKMAGFSGATRSPKMKKIIDIKESFYFTFLVPSEKSKKFSKVLDTLGITHSICINTSSRMDEYTVLVEGVEMAASICKFLDLTLTSK